MSPRSRRVVVVSRWWLRGGTESCVFCFGSYAHGRERHCPVCDRPLCPDCVDPARDEALCPDCAPLEA